MKNTDKPAAMKFIDLHAQFARIEDDIRAAIDRVLQHGQFIMGPEVFELERELAEYCGVAHAVSAASGTDALLIALMARGVGRGDAVIVPPFTFVATAEVVQLLGATAVFADVDAETFNLDPQKLHAAAARVRREGKLKLRGVIPVDLFGLPADYAAIAPIAEEFGLFVLSDAAQSFGGARGGVRAGAFGDAAATSFFPAKPLGAYGDGGALFTDDDEQAELARSIRVHGMGEDRYDNIRTGVTGRLDTMQAAVLRCKLRVFERRTRRAPPHRRALHARVGGRGKNAAYSRRRAKRLGAIHIALICARRNLRKVARARHPDRAVLPAPAAPPVGVRKRRRRRRRNAGVRTTGARGVQSADASVSFRGCAGGNYRGG